METQDKYRILLVDDEPDILEFLSYNIGKSGYQVATATNGRDALALADKIRPHLIILDVMMPDMDGIETCEELRKSDLHRDVIIVFLTARSEDYSQIAGFSAGADDYISKPVKPKVLISRIGAMLRRIRLTEERTVSSVKTEIPFEGITIDKERFIVIFDGEELTLPKKEFELLALLISKPEKVFTRDEIFVRIWDTNTVVGERTIDVHIRKLREKLGNRHIKTIKGVGYKYSDQ